MFRILQRQAYLLVLALLAGGPRVWAQIEHNMQVTICDGESFLGYAVTGVYRDTFPGSGGRDSVRILDLTVVPETGAGPGARWFNTGSNGAGGRLPVGSRDLHWEVSETGLNGAYAPAFVMTPNSAYVPSIWPDCAWIAHSLSGGHGGDMDYYYRIRFELPCLDTCGRSFDQDSNFCLTLEFFADNSVYEIYINGIPQSPVLGGVIPVTDPYQHRGFEAARKQQLTLCRSWKRGVNTLVVQIRSGQPYAGFLAQASLNDTGTAPSLRAGFEITGTGTGPADSGCAPYDLRFVNTSAGAVHYEWDFGDGSPVSNEASPAHTYTSAGIYTVTLRATTTVCGLREDVIRKTVSVYEPVMPDISASDPLVCNEGKVRLTVQVRNPSSRHRFSWTPAAGISAPADSASVLADPVLAQRYIVRVTDSVERVCGVSASDTVNITYVPRSIRLFTRDTLVCEGSVVRVLSTGSPGYTYQWTPVRGISNPSSLSPLITAGATTVYTLTGSYPGCPDTAITLRLETQPYPKVYLGPDTAVCEHAYVELEGLVSPQRNDYAYYWASANTQITGQGTPRIGFTAGISAGYDLKVSTPAGCSDSAGRLVQVYPGGFGTVMPDTGYCPPDTLRLHAAGGISYRWSPQYALDSPYSAGPLAGPESSTTYTVYIGNEQGCTDTLQVHVDVHARAVVRLPDTMRIHRGAEAYLEPESNCLYFEWFPFQGLSDPYSSRPRIDPAVDTRYFLKAVTEHGCAVTDSVDVLTGCPEFDIPNVFAPASASGNGVFRPVRQGAGRLILFTVYNRWGKKVFESRDMDAGWDGTSSGEPQPAGVYVYLLEVEDACGGKVVRQGNLTLLR